MIYDGIYYVSHEEEKALEDSKAVFQTKQMLRELDKIISPEMHAFVRMHYQTVRKIRALRMSINWVKIKQMSN